MDYRYWIAIAVVAVFVVVLVVSILSISRRRAVNRARDEEMDEYHSDPDLLGLDYDNFVYDEETVKKLREMGAQFDEQVSIYDVMKRVDEEEAQVTPFSSADSDDDEITGTFNT